MDSYTQQDPALSSHNLSGIALTPPAADNHARDTESPIGSVSQAAVDSIIRKKRKQREYKACYPCRSRKVKCDQQIPCKSCIDRHHPEVCTYHPPVEGQPPEKRLDNGARHGSVDTKMAPLSADPFDVQAASPLQASESEPFLPRGETITLATEDFERLLKQVETLTKSLTDVQNAMKHLTKSSKIRTTSHMSLDYFPPEAPSSGHQPAAERPPLDPESRHYSTEGIHARNELGEVIHIGGNSVPALVMALGKGEGDGVDFQDLLGKSILPVFGLENESATYPFISLWGMPSSTLTRIQDLARAIPDETDCHRFFHCYRDTAHIVYPAIADIAAFQDNLLTFLTARSEASTEHNPLAGINERSIHGKSLFWIGLLFATLASGSQCSDLPRKQRELTSQVYVCCSFECLRLTNFFGHATLESIQTLLVLGNVISNNMNAGVAWALLGLTVRLAQGLGLHKECPSRTPLAARTIRSRIWWAVMWQDSLLSITYDRASSATSLDHSRHFPPSATASQGGGWSYDECMYRLCQVGLDIVRERATPRDNQATMLRISGQKQELQEIVANAADYLKDSRCCRSMMDQLQHWALYLHMSYVMSELCRPAVSPAASNEDIWQGHRRTCVDSLVNTVEAFLGLQNITTFASRSWAAIHRALSSALLLSILREPTRNIRTKNLIDKFVTCLVDLTADIDPTELSTPIKRSLAALVKLNEGVTPPVPSGADMYSPTAATATASSLSTASGLELDADGPGTGLDASGMLNVSPLLGLSTGDSPYAVMDQILWGQKQSPTAHGY